MLKKILFVIIIFPGCTSSQLLNEAIVDQSASLALDVISGKSKKQKTKLERDKILNSENISEPKREIGEEWIDSNGKKWVQRNGYRLEVSGQKVQTYTGWWIYGEGQHIFKDEKSLGEWALTFPNENIEELVELYLAVCEMEYFPMECNMIGELQNDTLIVANFEITYIQGCGE